MFIRADTNIFYLKKKNKIVFIKKKKLDINLKICLKICR